MSKKVIEYYDPHRIILDDKYQIVSTTHNSYILQEVGVYKTGKNVGEPSYKDIAYGDVPHLIKRYMDELTHDQLAGKEVTLTEFLQTYKDIHTKVMNMMEDVL